MPTTMSEHKRALHKPPLCELLSVRDYLDGVAVQLDGSLSRATNSMVSIPTTTTTT